MPRPEKYSSPEMKAVAHDYHVLKRQQDLREKIITKLGGKCMLCGTTNPAHLKLIGNASKNWNKRWADVKAFPALFALRCANCDIESLQLAARMKLEGMANILFKDTMNLQAIDAATNEGFANEPTETDQVATADPI